ncbi:copper homeostasis protein CutC [Metabacillus idriensis]|uniref:copper homeostasis protein CutC n=1 Tax=Metabacillus idriensis TaxID=324768 RepID=UPI002812C13D|nr:copper homeostasis protein CutC [Metabacillus idriensis]MDR0136640.1 copper homeostasis protein CutC [Metabacillus idriensis]
MIIEAIADSLEDAITAQTAGADRIELVTGLMEGGLTPSYGLIRSVCSGLTIPVNVMIRPHSRSFCYSDEDLNIMLEDIEICRKLGAAGVVFGVLNNEKEIHEEKLTKLIRAAKGLDITFHRAFDEANHLAAALGVLQKYPEITRVLTSGSKDKATEAIEELSQLAELSAGTGLSIMAGSGLTPQNLSAFLEKVNVREVHFGSGIRYESNYSNPIDPLQIKAIRKIVT